MSPASVELADPQRARRDRRGLAVHRVTSDSSGRTPRGSTHLTSNGTSEMAAHFQQDLRVRALAHADRHGRRHRSRAPRRGAARKHRECDHAIGSGSPMSDALHRAHRRRCGWRITFWLVVTGRRLARRWQRARILLPPIGSAGGPAGRAHVIAHQLVDRRLLIGIGRPACCEAEIAVARSVTAAVLGRVRRMVGRMNTIRLVLVRDLPCERNSSPHRDVAEQRDLLDRAALVVARAGPPIAIWPSSTVIVVSISRLLRIRSRIVAADRPGDRS
jgi:hypothetical protein